MPQIPIGPIDPDDPESGAKAAAMVAAVEAAIDEAKAEGMARNQMKARGRMLEVKELFESLDDKQLVGLRELIGGLSIEGRDNYQTAMVHGILQGMEWARDISPFDAAPDVRFAGLEQMIDRIHHVLPVTREDDEDWAPEEAAGRSSTEADRDDPDPAA